MYEILEKLKDKKILVIGDICLDRFRIVDKVPEGSARESANLPILRYTYGKQGHKDSYSPGAGGNLAWNFASIGAQVSVLGVIGNDYNGYILKKELERKNIGYNMLITSEYRSTITFEKTFDISNLSTPIQRWDSENGIAISPEIESELLKKLKENYQDFDVIVAIDHCEMDRSTAIITNNTLECLVELKGKIKTFGTSRNHIEKFKNFYCVVINDNELVLATKTYQVNNFTQKIPLEEIKKALPIFYNQTNCEILITTLGEMGAIIYDSDGESLISTTPLKENIDTCGCGDTFLATFTLAEISGFNKKDAIRLANKSAGWTAKQIGTTGAPTLEDLLNL